MSSKRIKETDVERTQKRKGKRKRKRSVVIDIDQGENARWLSILREKRMKKHD